MLVTLFRWPNVRKGGERDRRGPSIRFNPFCRSPFAYPSFHGGPREGQDRIEYFPSTEERNKNGATVKNLNMLASTPDDDPLFSFSDLNVCCKSCFLTTLALDDASRGWELIEGEKEKKENVPRPLLETCFNRCINRSRMCSL